MASPVSKLGYLLTVFLEPDEHGTSPAPGPWALKVGKRQCNYIAGPAKRKGPTYRCGRRGPFLFGKPNKSKQTWTIRRAKKRNGAGARRVRVRTAWE